MKNFKTIKGLARILRKNPTYAERKLWKVLRKKKLSGLKFLRQHPIIYNQRQNKLIFSLVIFIVQKRDWSLNSTAKFININNIMISKEI